MSKAFHFTVLSKSYAALAGWFQFFPSEEVKLIDRVMAEKFYRSQWDHRRAPGEEGHSILLSPDEVMHVRLWFDYIPDVVIDESDEDLAEYMDEYMTRVNDK